MTKMKQLQIEALKATDFRGHNMGEFVVSERKPHCSFSHCQDCDMQVVVNTDPAPNEIDIGGEAVALTCSRA